MSDKNGPNNPAGRLLIVINGLRNQKNRRMHDAWGEALKVDPNEISKLIERVSFVSKLVDETEFRIKSLEDLNHELYLRWVPLVRKIFISLNLDTNLTSINQTLSPEALAGLEFCDDVLSQRCPEKMVDPEKLTELTNEVQQLMDDVLKSDLPDDLREFILDKLDLLLRALEMYQFTGIKPLSDALDGVIGSTLRSGKEWNVESINTVSVQNFWGLLGKISIIINFAESGQKLLGSAFEMIANK